MQIGNYYINKLQIILFGILLIGLITAVYLVQIKQIFKSKATSYPVHFEVIEDTNPQTSASCQGVEGGTTCTTKSLNIIIKPKIED